MVDSQVVEYEKDLLVRGLDQLVEKLKQPLGVHGATVNHESHLALVGHRRNHIHRGPFRGQPNHRGLTSGRIATSMLAVIAHPRLIAPMNLGLFVLGHERQSRDSRGRAIGAPQRDVAHRPA